MIMDEYVSLAHDFFDGSEPKFVNGVLEKMGKDLILTYSSENGIYNAFSS